MLAYRFTKRYSEIMMTHGGNSVDKWMPEVKDYRHKVHFAADLLR